MIRWRLLLWVVLMSPVALDLGVAHASCVCAHYTAREIIDKSATIALAKVKRVVIVPDSCSGQAPARDCLQDVSLDVRRWLKGAGPTRIEGKINSSVYYCGLRLTEGDEFLVIEAAEPRESICMVYSGLEPATKEEIIQRLWADVDRVLP